VGSTPCLLYTILCVVFEARVINLCDHDIATYAQRWRHLAAQVHPPLQFANTLKASYYEHMMGSSAQQFTDVVAVVERIQ